METPRFYQETQRKIPRYDPRFVEALIEDGLSEAEAIMVASAEMEGANENDSGICSTQTYCNELMYNESTGHRDEIYLQDPFQIDEDSDEIIYNDIYD